VISKRFGATVALDSVSVTVDPDELVEALPDAGGLLDRLGGLRDGKLAARGTDEGLARSLRKSAGALREGGGILLAVRAGQE